MSYMGTEFKKLFDNEVESILGVSFEQEETAGLEGDNAPSTDTRELINGKLRPHLKELVEETMRLSGDELKKAAVGLEETLLASHSLIGCSVQDVTVGVESDSTEEEIRFGLEYVLSKLST